MLCGQKITIPLSHFFRLVPYPSIDHALVDRISHVSRNYAGRMSRVPSLSLSSQLDFTFERIGGNFHRNSVLSTKCLRISDID